MGGHQAGEVASELVVKCIRDFLGNSGSAQGAERPPGRLSEAAERLLAGIESSNRVVYQTASENQGYRGMGSTLAAVYFTDDTLIAANVGDSPIYLMRSGKIDVLSVPHTLLAELPVDASLPIMGNILTRAVGSQEFVEADICELNCFKGDILVICSDGLSTQVAATEILAIAATQPPAAACRALVDLANQRGGDDNISVVVLKVTSVRRHDSSGFGRWIGRMKQRLTSIGI
jgi:protein phosphatase